MNIEEEKKLVLDFLGYETYQEQYLYQEGISADSHSGLWKFKKDTISPYIYFSDWNPQDNETGHKWWDEIWEKLTEEQWDQYERELIHLRATSMRKLITAKPDIRWKALIPVLQKLQQTKA